MCQCSVCSGAKQVVAEAAKVALATHRWVTAELLQARCEPELLEAAGVIVAEDKFQGKVVRMKTQLMFTQRKFNLLREESEGYSKVVTVLCHQNVALKATARLTDMDLTREDLPQKVPPGTALTGSLAS